MVRLRTSVMLLVPALLLPCCAKFGAADGESAAPADASGDGQGGDETSAGDGASRVDGPPLDDAADGSDATGACDPRCKGTAPPCGVPIVTNTGAFCIDPTEVTVDRYAAFLAVYQTKTFPLDAPCGDTPIVARANEGATMPITNVTWCEARAYCKWAGKQLCGTTDGKAITADENATQSSAWYHACTAGSAGHKLLGTKPCRLGSTVGPLASGTTCEGGYPGLFDMPGNVSEWVDYRVLNNGFAVGGAYGQPPNGDTCAPATNTPITNPLVEVGFRCCSY